MSAMLRCRTPVWRRSPNIASSKEIIPTRLSFVDIAGLVRGASKGEGLGNQFLGNIRECDAIAHVVRCFEDGDVTHVEGRVDPLSDIATIETELMLADLESLERRIAQMEKKAKGGDKEAKELLALAERSLGELKEGRPARAIGVSRDERRLFQSLGLLSSKPVLYVCNVEEGSADRGNAYSDLVKEQAAKEGAVAAVVSAKIESEIALLPPAEQEAYLEAIGLTEPGLAASFAQVTGSCILSLSSPWGRRRRAPGRSSRGPGPRRRPASSTRISKRALSAPKPLPMTTMSRMAARPAHVRRASSGSKARTMWSPTATSCISASRIERHAGRALFRRLSARRSDRIRRRDVSADEIIAFARDFDPQPFHTDEEAARAATGGLIASGWHTSALLVAG